MNETTQHPLPRGTRITMADGEAIIIQCALETDYGAIPTLEQYAEDLGSEPEDAQTWYEEDQEMYEVLVIDKCTGLHSHIESGVGMNSITLLTNPIEQGEHYITLFNIQYYNGEF